MVIPSDIGGFTVREAGIYDIEGDFIAIGKLAETYKPTLDMGAAKDLYIKFIMEVSNASSVTLTIDPYVVLCTTTKSEEIAQDKINNHTGEVNPHRQYVLKTEYNAREILNKLTPASSFTVTDAGGTNRGASAAFDGNGNVTMKLPAAIAANVTGTLTGNISGTASGIRGVLPVANGGTGQSSLQSLRNSLGLGNTTGVLPIANGGTGASSAQSACDNLIGGKNIKPHRAYFYGNDNMFLGNGANGGHSGLCLFDPDNLGGNGGVWIIGANSWNVGGVNTPVYISNGVFQQCNNLVSVTESGNNSYGNYKIFSNNTILQWGTQNINFTSGMGTLILPKANKNRYFCTLNMFYNSSVATACYIYELNLPYGYSSQNYQYVTISASYINGNYCGPLSVSNCPIGYCTYGPYSAA